MSVKSPVRIVVIVPPGAARQRMHRAVANQADLDLIDTFTDPDQARLKDIAARSDLLLVHYRYAQAGSEFLRWLGSHQVRFIVIDAPADPAQLARYLEAGAIGYLRADEPVEEIIASVVRGSFHDNIRIDPFVTAALLNDYRQMLARHSSTALPQRQATVRPPDPVRPLGIEFCQRRQDHSLRKRPHQDKRLS